MKKYILFLFTVIIINAKVTAQEIMYVIAKQGLNVYEAPLFNSKILGKVAYGKKIIIDDRDHENHEDYKKYKDSLYQKVVQEGLEGYWQRVEYNNKRAYIITTYLLPTAPPLKGVTTIVGYLKQISTIAGIAKTNKYFSEYSSQKRVKTLYKNGMESYIKDDGDSETYTLPDFSVQQAFLLLRLLKFKSLTEKDVLPVDSLPVQIPGEEKEETTSISNSDDDRYQTIEVIRKYGIERISISPPNYRIKIYDSEEGETIIHCYVDEPGC